MSQKQREDNSSEEKLRILRKLLENDDLPAKERIDDALTLLKKQSVVHKNQNSAQKHDIDKELDPKYQLILDHSPLAVLHFNKEGIITHCNNQLVELLGSSREALLGLDMTQLPDQQVVQALRDAQNGKTGHYRGHYKSVTSGKVIPVHGIFIPLREKGGSPAGGIAIIEDVTERIESQKQLRKFRLGIDRSPNPVFTTDTDGHIQYTNAAFEKLYGYTSKEVIGKNPRILKSGKQTEEFYKDFWRTITTGNVSRGEMINKTADGEYVNVLYSCSPIMGSDGEIIGFISIQDDITERKEMEANIRETLEEKELMLSEIHHRVKNNLALISALLTLQIFKTDDESLQQKLSESTLRIKTIANVHEHLYQSGSLKNISFHDNCRSLIQNIKDTLQFDTKIQLNYACSDHRISITQAIHLLLIINEVVSNIIHHAFEGLKQGVIEVTSQVEKGHFHLTILDNGSPLPEGFPQSANSSMGLELISILRQELNAEISFQRNGELNRFSCTFPIVTPEEEILSFRKFQNRESGKTIQ